MYKTKKFKADLKRKEEQRKIKDAAKVAKTAKKEQAKLNAEDRVIRKKPKNMTDEELRNEVNRLAMELDYQKKSWQVERGKKGPSALDKADEFFERPTGRIVAEVGKNIVTQVASNALTNIIKEKTSSIEQEKLKGQKLKNKKAKAEAKKAEIEKDAAQKDYDSKYGKKENKEGKTESKSAEEYVKDAFSGAKGKKGQAWGKKESSSSGAETNKKEKTYTGNPFTPPNSEKTGSSSSSNKGFTFDPVDPISSEIVNDYTSKVINNLSLPSGNSTLLLPSESSYTLSLKKLGLK